MTNIRTYTALKAGECEAWLQGLELPPSVKPRGRVRLFEEEREYIIADTKNFGSIFLYFEESKEGRKLCIRNTDDHNADYLLMKEWETTNG